MTNKSANGKNRKSEAPEGTVMGRPRKEIDFEQLAKAVQLQATQAECANLLGVSLDTLSARIREEYNQTFSQFFKAVAPFGRLSLRRALWQEGIENRNIPTLHLLAKNYLGLTDKLDATFRGTGPDGSHLVTDWSKVSSQTLLELKANSVIATTDDEPDSV